MWWTRRKPACLSTAESRGRDDRRRPYRQRRLVGAALVLGALVLVSLRVAALRDSLEQPAFFTGYILLGCVFFLAAFNFRKMFPALPLGDASTWMQVHIYVGFFTIGLFLLHLPGRIPDGQLEWALAAVFTFVAVSGLYGLYITRTAPRQLASLREQVVFERIPTARIQIAVAARERAVAILDTSTILAQTYERSVGPFLNHARSMWYYLWPTGSARRALVAELRGLNRYLDDAQQKICRELELFVCQKDDLDYHAAIQGRLKMWLFAHIGATYSLIVLAVCHGILAHAFHGGAR